MFQNVSSHPTESTGQFMVESFGFLPFMYLPPPQRLFSGDADNVEDTASIQKNFNPLLFLDALASLDLKLSVIYFFSDFQ